MTTDLQLSTAELLDLLDPDRPYGDRSYDDVVAAVRAGELLLEPGYNLPVIRDAKTRRAVAGTGRPPGTMGPQQTAINEFRHMAIDDVPEVYRKIMEGVRKGEDWHWVDLYLKYVIGKVGEVRGGDAMAEAFKALIEAMKQPERRTVTILDA